MSIDPNLNTIILPCRGIRKVPEGEGTQGLVGRSWTIMSMRGNYWRFYCSTFFFLLPSQTRFYILSWVCSILPYFNLKCWFYYFYFLQISEIVTVNLLIVFHLVWCQIVICLKHCLSICWIYLLQFFYIAIILILTCDICGPCKCRLACVLVQLTQGVLFSPVLEQGCCTALISAMDSQPCWTGQ